MESLKGTNTRANFQKVKLNVAVRVKLTRFGAEILNRYNVRIAPQYEVPKAYAKQWYEFHLWELMYIFGSQHFMGNDDCFEDSVVYFNRDFSTVPS